MKLISILVAVLMGFFSVTLWYVYGDFVNSVISSFASFIWCHLTVKVWEQKKQ